MASVCEYHTDDPGSIIQTDSNVACSKPANPEQRFKTFLVMAHAHLQGHFICPTTFHFQTQPQI